MVTLFSPVGKTDPMGGLHDGPLIHIVRWYLPDEIVLFISPYLLRFEEQDARYTEAINLLVTEKGGSYNPKVRIVKSDVGDSHLYDRYIPEMKEFLDSEPPETQFLFNLTSGTPAMNQALTALYSLGIYEGSKAIQVSSPSKGPNSKFSREEPEDFVLNDWWQVNEDNKVTSPNRCIEVGSTDFKELLLIESIRVLVKSYDYTGASALARQSKSIDGKTRAVIEGTVRRFDGNLKGARDSFINTRFAIPIKIDEKNILEEYLNTLEVKLETGKWSDFVRALTPAFTSTLRIRLEDKLPSSYWLRESGSKPATLEIDWASVNQNEKLIKVLKGDEGKKIERRFPTNGDFYMLLKEYGEDKDVLGVLRKIREFEIGVRNLVAHEVTNYSYSEIEFHGGMSMSTVLDYLFEINEAEKGLYNRINKWILKHL